MSDPAVERRVSAGLWIAAYGGEGTWPTASIKLMHYLGDLEGQGPVWATSRADGLIRCAIAKPAVERARRSAAGVRCGETRSSPAGVNRPTGRCPRAGNGVCNADQKRPRCDCLGDSDAAFRADSAAGSRRESAGPGSQVHAHAALAERGRGARRGLARPRRRRPDSGLDGRTERFEKCDRASPPWPARYTCKDGLRQ